MKRAFFSCFCFSGVYILLTFMLLFTPSIKSVYAARISNRPTFAASTQVVDFKNFVGSWVRHDAGLQFNADGSGVYSERVYQWCGPSVPPPCDAFQGNTIIPGDREKIQFTRTDNTIAYGKVTSSTFNNSGLEVTLTRTVHNDTVSLASTAGHFTIPRLLCGPRAAVGLCGA